MGERPWTGRRVLSIASLKGGVGKSTTAMMIADALSVKHSVRVLLIDLDAQANLSQMVLSYRGLVRSKQSGKTVTKWLEALGNKEGEELFQFVSPEVSGLKELASKMGSRTSTDGDLSIVSATPELRFSELAFDHLQFDRRDPAAPRKTMCSHLEKAMRSLESSYDLILFDCPPAFSTLSQAALSLSDAIISPVLEEPLSAWSTAAFRDFGMIETLNKWDPNRHRVLFTRVSRRGANEERLEVRDTIRRADFNTFNTSIKEAADAHRWTQRPAPESINRFAKKYGSERRNVQGLGQEVVQFIQSIPERQEDYQ